MVLICKIIYSVLKVRLHRKSGDNSGEATPVPISNTEVKLLSADDTWWEAAWESRTLPVFLCGSGSGVEHRLAKARVASSNLVFRSNTTKA